MDFDVGTCGLTKFLDAASCATDNTAGMALMHEQAHFTFRPSILAGVLSKLHGTVVQLGNDVEQNFSESVQVSHDGKDPFWAGAVWHGYACFELFPQAVDVGTTFANDGTGISALEQKAHINSTASASVPWTLARSLTISSPIIS